VISGRNLVLQVQFGENPREPAMIDANTSPKSAPLESAAFKDQKFNELFAVLEDLLKRIADTDDPEIRRKRAQVRAEMIAVQSNPQTLSPPQKSFMAPAGGEAEREEEADWGQQALVALAGAAVALSVFRHSS
jgi:hypothetical protein